MDSNIIYWQGILTRNVHGSHHSTARERLIAHLCSITLGRDFGESVESYIDRTGKREFWTWANNAVKEG